MGRLHRTLEGTNRIAFGRASEAEAIKARPTAVHGKVWGTVSPGINGPHDYSAFEPDLLFWVLATLISAAVNGYEFIYGALSIAPGRRPERADASAVCLVLRVRPVVKIHAPPFSPFDIHSSVCERLLSERRTDFCWLRLTPPGGS
jgi:hypothetical protein